MRELDRALGVFRQQVIGEAAKNGVTFQIKSGWYWYLLGSGRTIVFTDHEKSYCSRPVPPGEIVRTVVVYHGSPLTEYHELHHAAQRITNPHWVNATLPTVEIEATKAVLPYLTARFPVTTFNLFANYILYSAINYIQNTRNGNKKSTN